jgi:hypothetical protein
MKAAVAATLLVVGVSTAQATEPTGRLRLACQGTTTSPTSDNPTPKPVSKAIIVNFTTRIVQGFGIPGVMIDFPIKITAMHDMTVAFSGSAPNQKSITGTYDWTFTGAIDRVTGDLGALFRITKTETMEIFVETSYALKCKESALLF